MSKDHINIHYYAEWREKVLKDYERRAQKHLDDHRNKEKKSIHGHLPYYSLPRPDTSVQAYTEYLLEQSPERGSH